MNTKKTVRISIAVLLVGLLGWGVYAFLNGKRYDSTGVVATSTAVTTGLPGIDYEYQNASSSAPSVSSVKLPKAPSLDRPITPPAYFLPAVAASSTERILDTIKAIKAQPGNAGLWANLGFYRKGIEDYQGAKEALEYSLALNPRNAVVTENLGVIYGDYLHDAKNAEKQYLAAIKLEPNIGYRYLRLYELYETLMHDSVKAKAIVEQGLKVNPGDASLKALLESLQ